MNESTSIGGAGRWMHTRMVRGWLDGGAGETADVEADRQQQRLQGAPHEEGLGREEVG